MGRRNREALWQPLCKRHQLAGLQRQPVLRLEAGDRGHGLDDVHAVHRLARFVAVPLGVGRSHGQKSGLRDAAQEVRVEREDYVRVLKLVLRVHVAAKRRLGRGARRVAIHRLPLHQLRRRKLCLRLMPLRGQRWRSDGLAEEDNPFAAVRLLHGRRKRRLKIRPLAGLPAQAHLLRAVRIVQIEKRSLGERVGLALRHWVVGISIHLDGAECVRLHQHRDGPGGKWERRGEVHRLAEDEVLGLLHVGEDRLIGLLGASRKPGQRKRRAHHLEKSAAADRIRPLAGRASGNPGKLRLQHLVEGGRLGQLVQVLPEALAALAVEPGANLGQRQLCHVFIPDRDRPVVCVRRRNRGHKLRAGLRGLHCGLACRLHRWHVSQLVSSLGGRMWY